MNNRIRELIIQTDEWLEENAQSDRWEREQKFAELIIDHATECVRDVLRDESSDLSYAAATAVQNRIKEFFGRE